MKDNIVLIGMPGCGKSTVGVVLAKVMGYKYIDADLMIQERESRRLSEIIQAEGRKGFDRIEESVLMSIDAERTVIATGGSAVYGRNAMAHLRSAGTTIYLKLPLEQIAERLGDLTKRGVSMGEGQTLKDLYDERTPLYEKYADMVIDCDGLDIRGVVTEITSRLPGVETYV